MVMHGVAQNVVRPTMYMYVDIPEEFKMLWINIISPALSDYALPMAHGYLAWLNVVIAGKYLPFLRVLLG